MVDYAARSLSVVTESIIHNSIQILRNRKFVDAGIGGRVARSVVLLVDGESTQGQAHGGLRGSFLVCSHRNNNPQVDSDSARREICGRWKWWTRWSLRRPAAGRGKYTGPSTWWTAQIVRLKII